MKDKTKQLIRREGKLIIKLIALSVLFIWLKGLIVHPSLYNEDGVASLYDLRSTYMGDDIAEEDKKRITPLQHNVSQLSIEDELDVFLNTSLTDEERQSIAAFIYVRMRFFITKPPASKEKLDRVYTKYEQANDLGLLLMAIRTIDSDVIDRLPTIHLCGATTKAGTPCKHQVSNEDGIDTHCWQHSNE